MDFNGKRTDRMRFPEQVAYDPEMSSEIRLRASRRGRSLGNQIIHLLTIGLSHDWEATFNEHGVSSTHAQSQMFTEHGPKVEGHIGAQPRTAGHRTSQRKAETA